MKNVALIRSETPCSDILNGWVAALRVLRAGAQHCRPGVPPLRARDVARRLIFGAVHLYRFRGWLADPANATLQEALAAWPSLICCTSRPYLHTQWSAARKLDAISEHYRLLDGRFSVLRVNASDAVDLGDTGCGVQVRLDKPHWAEHEGEVTIGLFNGASRLFSLTFCVGSLDDERVAYVGALQGIHGDAALETYRLMTHEHHGLRPRDLLLSAFRQLCRALGVHQIRAVSNRSSVSRDGYFGSSVAVLSDYDRVWQEHDAVLGADGFFKMSPQTRRRSAEEIPSRKRALYRRRYEMLDALAVQIGAAVDRAEAQQTLGTTVAELPRRDPATARTSVRKAANDEGIRSDFGSFADAGLSRW